jgi:hypothetical protein
MAFPDEPMERRRGPRAPLTGTPADQGKEMGAAPARNGVARPKVAVVKQGREPGGIGTIHHGGGGVGQQPHKVGQEPNQ